MVGSIEIFTPRNETQFAAVKANLRTMQAKGLKLCSITQSLKDLDALKSTAFLVYLKHDIDLDFVMHVTTSATSTEGLRQRFDDWKSIGVSKLLCLRGDLPETGITDINKSSIRLIRQANAAGFEPWASAYPSPHTSSLSKQVGLDWTFRKLEAGATTLVTQFCFDTDLTLEWLHTIQSRSPETCIRLGILPIRSIGQIQRIHAMNDLKVPTDVMEFCHRYADRKGNLPMAATQKHIWQTCRKLAQIENVDFHFYSFNQLNPTDWALGQDFSSTFKPRETTHVCSTHQAA